MPKKTCKDCCYFWADKKIRRHLPDTYPADMGGCCSDPPTIHFDAQKHACITVTPDVHEYRPACVLFAAKDAP